MEEIIAAEIARWIPDLIAYIFSNILTLTILAAAIALIVVMAGLIVKRRWTRRMLTEGQAFAADAKGRLERLLTSERFRDLELGLAEGQTEKSLRALQQEAFELRREAEELIQRMAGQRVPLLSLLAPYEEARHLHAHGERLLQRSKRVERELEEIDSASAAVSSSLQSRREEYRRVFARFTTCRDETGYPLERLQAMAEEVERELRRVERSAAFDGVQGRRDAEAVRRRLNRWAGAVDGIARDVRTWRGMKQRLAEREHDLRRMWASSGREAAGEEAMHEIAAIFAALEAKMRRGEQADLRQAAAQIERIIEQAADLP